MVAATLREGETTFEEVCRRYSVSPDELASWILASRGTGCPVYAQRLLKSIATSKRVQLLGARLGRGNLNLIVVGSSLRS